MIKSKLLCFDRSPTPRDQDWFTKKLFAALPLYELDLH